MKKIIVSALVIFAFSGCGIGSIVELPFKIVGGVVDIIPGAGVAAQAIEGIGSAINTTIPF